MDRSARLRREADNDREFYPLTPSDRLHFLNLISFLPMDTLMVQDIDLQEGISGAGTRVALLNVLFRETDRAQRMKSPFSLVLIALEPFGSFDSSHEDLLGEILNRIARFLRSYDLLGRSQGNEIFVLLPGCGASGAILFAERLRTSVFATPLTVGGETVPISGCFGITSSIGRSPIVVLRQAAQALLEARASGPGSIASFSSPRSRNL